MITSVKYKSWIEVSKSALFDNIEVFRKAVGKNVKIAAVVKANAYGHGLTEVVKTIKIKLIFLRLIISMKL